MVKKEFERIKRPSVSGIVADQITELIRNGTYVPGDKLPSQKELEEMMQVSRPTLREALARLAVMGLVEARQGQGYFVLPPAPAPGEALDAALGSNDGMRQLLEARLFLEGTLAQMACLYATDEEIGQLMDYVEVQEPAMIEADQVGSEKRSFHEMVADFAHNEFLAGFEKKLLELFLRHEAAFTKPDEPFLFDKYSFEPHRSIAQAIADRDAQRAYTESFRHIIKYTYDLSLKQHYEDVLEKMS